MEIVVRSLGLYKKNFWVYLIPFVASGLAIGLLNLVVQALLPIQLTQYSSPLSALIESPSVLLQSIVLTALISPINALIDGIGVGITVESLEHGSANLNGGYTVAKSKFRQLLYVVILTELISDLAFSVEFVGLIPEIIFFVVIPIVVIEGKPVLSVLKRSWQLVYKRWIAVFELLIVAGLIAGVPFIIITLVTAFESPAEILASTIYSGLVAPILVCMSTVFYYSSAARLSAPPSAMSAPPSQPGNKLWVCKNCGTTFVMSSMPSQTIFGGCLKAKRGWMQPTGKHDWQVSETDVSSFKGTYCVNCGKPLNPLDEFCSSCGRAVR